MGVGKSGAVLHVRELEGVCRARMVRIVNDQIRFGHAVAELDDFDVAVRFPADTLVAVLAENHGLAVFELEDVLAAGIAVGQREPCAVVEDVAVLQNFHVGRTFVRGRVFQRLFQVSLKTSTERATKVASDPMASETGLNGRSSDPRASISLSC